VIASLLSRIADALHLGVSFLFVAAVVAAALLLGGRGADAIARGASAKRSLP